ncbi:MAG TPA: 6,7-dimethyl-8-ribityllumazine synthase [Bacteroidia bacterium]|jgi:6,7-dimethyl-8-ribityllumazine synthase|nr:6,7-dimethyl-8-ribityllumazine synthase [Bacteroidia bacterium]
MATALKNLSDQSQSHIPSAKGMRFAILVSEWNPEITGSLFRAAKASLLKHGVKSKNIIHETVPGSFELSLGAQFAAQLDYIDAVICLGCVIQGETRHFDFICNAVANGITNVGLMYNKPVVFGVLTTNDLKQAKERAGGKHGNKGVEAAITAIKMVALKHNLRK